MGFIDKGKRTTSKELLDEIGDAAVGLIVSGEIPLPWIVVQHVEDTLQVVPLDSNRPVATDWIRLPADDTIYVVKNPKEVIKEFGSRFHLICKAYGLRH